MDFKNLFNLDEIYGKKLVTIVYHAILAVIAVMALLSLLSGILQIFTAPFMAIIRIMLTVPLAVVAFLVLRVICEVVTVFFEKNNK